MGKTKVHTCMDGLVQNIVCLDSSNCNQENTFFNSLWKIIPPPCFCFPLYHFQGAFCSVLNCTVCSLLFSAIFHFLFTTFAWQPFLAKTIQGSLHLICIINRLHKRATFKRKQNKHRNEQDGWGFRAEKRSAQASAHPLSQAQGGLFCVLTVFVWCWSSEWNARGANVCSL